jgi:Tfp pilus assembly protein PilF
MAEDYPAIIGMLDKQIESAPTDAEKAKLCCFKARNHLNNKNLVETEQGYLEALDYSYTGWILNEYSRFLFRTGEYERAYRAASKVAEDFPQFEREAESIKRKAKQAYEKEYLEANPPTIIMNTKVDPNRVTRHDLIRRAAVRNQTVQPSKKSIPSSPRITKKTKTVRRS